MRRHCDEILKGMLRKTELICVAIIRNNARTYVNLNIGTAPLSYSSENGKAVLFCIVYSISMNAVTGM